MKTHFLNSQYNNNLHMAKKRGSGQYEFKENKIKNNYNKNINRPAQAISFGGSAVSGVHKVAKAFLENGKINNLVGYINENEAGFNAAYALIIAGMLKPGLVLAQTGFNDKDGQMIATKNFLQAFVGFFLGMTIGGGFIKKIWDKMSNDFNLMQVTEKDNKKILEVKSSKSDDAQGIAKKILKKEYNSFNNRLYRAKDGFSKAQNLKSKIQAFLNNFKKDKKYKPSQKLIDSKAQELVKYSKDHLSIFNKNESTKSFTIKLVENLEKLKINPSTARQELKNGLLSQPWDACESFGKNITNIPTVIAKAKISSLLLPVAVAAIFANRNAQDKIKKNQQKTNDATTITLVKSKEKYKNFEKVLSPNNTNNKPSFTGSWVNGALDKSTKLFEKMTVSKFGQGNINLISRISKKPSHLMSHLESFGITAYWLMNTHFSKKIDPDQKLGLNVHTALVTIISSITSFVIDTLSDGLIKKAENAYMSTVSNAVQEAKKTKENTDDIIKEVMNKCSKLYNSEDIYNNLTKNGVLNNDKKLASEIEAMACNYSKHLSKFKSLMIFTLVVRFLVPVLTVKQSKKIKKFLVEFSKKRSENKNVNEPQNIKSEKVA